MQLGKKLLRSRRLQMLQREIKTFLGTGINSYNSARTEKKTTFFDACSPNSASTDLFVEKKSPD